MATKTDTIASAAPAEAPAFDASKIEDDKFYEVRLARSTTLFGDPLPAARTPRLSGSAVKQIAADVFSAEEVAEDAKHEVTFVPPNAGPVVSNS